MSEATITHIMRSRAVSQGRIFTQYIGCHRGGKCDILSEDDVTAMVASGALYIDPTPVPLPAMIKIARRTRGNLPEYATAVRDAGGVVYNIDIALNHGEEG